MGGPGMVENTWLEGTYSGIYPNIRNQERDAALFRQFSFPGGMLSQCGARDAWIDPRRRQAPLLLSHAYSAALDNPDLIVACVVGDDKDKTDPLATSGHDNKFVSPASDDAAPPLPALLRSELLPGQIVKLTHSSADPGWSYLVA
jgi:xylulose-5-phosphate/fructose-6-phosphate phosphoketolase